MLPFTPIERVVESVIGTEVTPGTALAEYLVSRYDYLERPQWQEQIGLGNLEINGVIAHADTTIRPGDKLFFQALGLQEQEVSWDIQVLQETDDYLIVNKPANLPCHPAGRFFNHTLWAWLRQVRHLTEIHFVSRLDRETSGVMLIGKNAEFAARASKVLHAAGQQTIKEYIVAVHGRCPFSHCFANGFLMQDTASQVRKKKCFIPAIADGNTDDLVLPEDPEAVTAMTDLTRLGFCRLPSPHESRGQLYQDPEGPCTLLKARLYTGRTHQIRATMYSLGYPVIGDKLYGLDETIFLRLSTNSMTAGDFRTLALSRQALHACRIEIPVLGISAQSTPDFIANDKDKPWDYPGNS